MTPLISVIIVTFNAARTLTAAIRSVVDQSIPVELIVIDGGSTDDTLRITQQFSHAIAVLIAEPDNGIYEAMNKGIDRATGEWLYFLGADDALAPNRLKEWQPYLQLPCRVVCGDVQFDNGHRMQSSFGPRLWLQNMVHHQGAFYHRSLFAQFRYDTQYRTIADYALNLSVLRQRLPTRYIPDIVAYCQAGGASGDWKQTEAETNRVRAREIHSRWQQFALSTLLRLYYNWKSIHRAITGRNV